MLACNISEETEQVFKNVGLASESNCADSYYVSDATMLVGCGKVQRYSQPEDRRVWKNIQFACLSASWVEISVDPGYKCH